jgi:hypothetical protein
VSHGHKLYFLVDSGADIGLVKNYKFLRTAKFEPKDRLRVKSVEGSVTETHSSIVTQIREGGIDILFLFQLVSQRVDLKGDGIIVRDFLKLRWPEFAKKKIPDFSGRRVCNTQEIKNVAEAGMCSVSGSMGR